jgi:DNA-binding phage protein
MPRISAASSSLVAMDTQSPDLRERVIAELNRRLGDLAKIAKETELSYDTVLRIKNREGDPFYGKIRRLADYFGFDLEPAPPPAAPPTEGETTERDYNYG